MEERNVKITNKNQIKRYLAILLVVVIICANGIPVKAIDINSSKEEVAYGNLKSDGSVSDVYVVNIFDQSGNIVDYGDYSEVRNMNTEDDITMNNNKITVNNSGGDKLYYEGTLKNQNLPWNISIKYYIDGNEYSADDIAGKSGALTIKMNITQNNNCDENFYKNYALQTTFTLDTSKCTNIVADNATIANVGNDKQLTYTNLPGKGADITISSDVTDFEMNSVTINGIKLNLGINVDDSELMSKIDELTAAVDKLDNGANSLKEGTSDLKDGASQLSSGAEKLKNGSSDLDTGVTSLKDGITKIQNALNLLNSKSDELTSGSAQVKDALTQIQTSLSVVSLSTDKIDQLVDASSKIKTGINQIYTSINTLKSNVGYNQYKSVMNSSGLDIDQLKTGNQNAINTLTATIDSLTASYNSITDETQKAQLKAEIDQLTNVVTLLKGNNAAIGGTESYLNGVSSAISSLYDGAAALNTQYETFNSAIIELSQSLKGMLVDMSSLSTAINTLVDKYTMLDKGISDYTNGVAQIIVGYNGAVSGVNALSNGSKALNEGNSTLSKSTNSLMAGISQVYDGTVNLKDGTGELKDNTSNIKPQVNDQIDSTLSEVKGDNSKVTSFVSKDNTNIKSVQFVIKTDAIKEKAVAESTETTDTQLNVWQKFLRLFGLY